jgi:hypothetical protein
MPRTSRHTGQPSQLLVLELLRDGHSSEQRCPYRCVAAVENQAAKFQLSSPQPRSWVAKGSISLAVTPAQNVKIGTWITRQITFFHANKYGKEVCQGRRGWIAAHDPL